MSPHRTPGDVIPDGDPLPQGPAKKCKGCGAEAIDGKVKVVRPIGNDEVRVVGRADMSPLPAPRACTPASRVRIGWFRRCAWLGSHLHERCKVCGHQWLTSFAEGT